MSLVLALDLSSTRTGICCNGEVSSYTPPKGSLLDRARATRRHISELCWTRPDLVIIEAIGTRMVNTAIALATVHALVLDEFEGWAPAPIQMVAPADLKKFATGKGNADKDSVMLAAAKLEPRITNNDEADAWWLWAIGSWLTDTPFIETRYRHTVINKLKGKEAA